MIYLTYNFTDSLTIKITLHYLELERDLELELAFANWKMTLSYRVQGFRISRDVACFKTG